MRLNIQYGEAGSEPASIGKPLAVGFVALAVFSSFLSILGWLFDVAVLRDYGQLDHPIWPLTAIGYFALSLGFLAMIRDRLPVARALWAVPMAIAAVTMFQNGSGIDLGVDELLFGESVRGYDVPYPGRPGGNPVVTFLLLAGAGYITTSRPWLRAETRGVLASAAMALAGVVALLVLISVPDEPYGRLYSISLPASVSALALAGACVAWYGNLGWVKVLAANRSDWRLLRVLVPVALVLPAVPVLLESLIERGALMSPFLSKLLVALSMTALVAAIVYWAVARVASEQAALVQFTEALDSATVALTTADGRITHWSRGCEQLYGWTAGEAIGRHKYVLLQSRCQQWWATGLPRAGRDGATELIELHRDGRELAVIESVRAIATPGYAQVLVLSITDISQTASAMGALKASEERLAVATAAHEVGIFEWDVPSGRIEWSPGTEQRLGLRPGTITDYDSWRSQVEPADVASILETIAATVTAQADVFTFRYRFLQPNGSVRAVEGSARTFYDGAGNLLRSVGVILDTTERDERERQLRTREAQLRSILETVPDAMVVMNAHGTILQFSAAAEALWGFRADAVVGREFRMLAPADARERYAAALKRFRATGERAGIGRDSPAVGEKADGTRFPIEIRSGVSQVGDDTLFTLFCRDLTDQLAAEERMSELNAELEHVSRQSAMSELAADMAHELNQPLSATSNFLAAARMLLDKGEDIGRVTDLLRMGSEQTQRAGQIIRRLRDFVARREAELRIIELDETMRDAVEMVLVGTGQFHIRLSYALEPDARQVLADRVQVQQVIVNLLRNAMEALRGSPSDKREIIIGSRQIEGNMVEIEVGDTGPGIPAGVLENLFSRFTTTKGRTGGMGIGLSISKRIIESYGGTLSAENRPQGGASFRFTLPAAGEYEE